MARRKILRPLLLAVIETFVYEIYFHYSSSKVSYTFLSSIHIDAILRFRSRFHLNCKHTEHTEVADLLADNSLKFHFFSETVPASFNISINFKELQLSVSIKIFVNQYFQPYFITSYFFFFLPKQVSSVFSALIYNHSRYQNSEYFSLIEVVFIKYQFLFQNTF